MRLLFSKELTLSVCIAFLAHLPVNSKGELDCDFVFVFFINQAINALYGSMGCWPLWTTWKTVKPKSSFSESKDLPMTKFRNVLGWNTSSIEVVIIVKVVPIKLLEMHLFLDVRDWIEVLILLIEEITAIFNDLVVSQRWFS